MREAANADCEVSKLAEKAAAEFQEIGAAAREASEAGPRPG
jgi:hypothetical protein